MISQPGQFTPQQLLEKLKSLPAATGYCVGFSGGADSTALLEALHETKAKLGVPIRAVHFNHNLQADAQAWQEHCEAYCRGRNISLVVQTLKLEVGAQNSAELQARQARYHALATLLKKGEIYLTAHHANDQAETLLLNLVRGSGLDGLAGIPALRKLGRGQVARPLLQFYRQDLEAFLRQRKVNWITDPSNLEVLADRNFLRNEVLPVLDTRWQGISQRLNQSREHAAHAISALSQLISDQYESLLSDPACMPLEPFLQIDQHIQALVLRQWLKSRAIPTPPRLQLQEFLDQLHGPIATHSMAEIRWGNYLLKRYDTLLWLLEVPFPDKCPALTWGSSPSLQLDREFGCIRLNGPAQPLPDDWEIGPRRTSASIRLRRSGPRTRVKEILRACGVPTWLRECMPMLYRNGELHAVGDSLVSEEFSQWLAKNRLSYSWHPVHPLLCKLQSVSVQCLITSEYNHERNKGPKTGF